MHINDRTIRPLASAGLLGAAIIWGFAFVVVKNSLDQIPPTWMLAFRFTIAALVLGGIFYRRIITIDRGTLFQGGVLGALLFFSYLVQTIGCQYTTAGKNAFLTAIYVILVPFFHWVINRVRPDLCCVTAALMAIVGIGLLSLQGDMTMNAGDVLTIFCGFGFALHMIYIDKYTEVNDPVVLTALQLGFAAVFSWILAPVLDGGFPAAAFQPGIVAGMLYLGIFSTMVGFLLQNVCQKYTAPDTASILLSMESVFGMLFSVLFLGERMTLRMIAGCVILFAAIVLAETKLSFLPFPGREVKRRV